MAFADARAVTHLMGGHIEMTNRPGHGCPMGANYQRDEVPLPMPPAQLVKVAASAHAAATRPGTHVFDDFVIYNGPCRTAVLRHLGRTLLDRLGNAVSGRREARTPR